MKKNKVTLHYIIVCLLVAFMVFLDQWSKHLAVIHLKDKTPGTVIVMKKLLQLTYVENRGTAFGIGQGKVWLFTLTSIVILAFVIYLYRKIPFEKRYIPMRMVGILLAAGAIGNMIDRIAQGYVVDFFEFGFIDFPVFNVADIYVTVAEVMLIGFGLLFYKEEDFVIFASKKTDTLNIEADQQNSEDVDNDGTE